ncbi:MAG: glycosyltransferase family 9 protein [Rubritepida sp.]|nr:glycosyltransferase family 9 protein [Rubritepida sp.]
MQILFISSTRIGDAVLSTGLLAVLLERHPGARITVACGPAAEGVFTRMPGLERLWLLRKRRWSAHWLGLWRHALVRRWDLVVDLRGSAMAWLVPARARAVMRGGRRPGHRLAHLAQVLGLAPPPLPVAWWSAADAAALPPLPGRFLALGPTANWSHKVWPSERFVAVAVALDLPVVVLGGPGAAEAAMAAPVLAALPGAQNLVGQLSLPQAAALLSRASLYVGNDSGLMHLAAAAGAPTLGLFGPTLADEYGPAGPRARAVLADPHESPDGASELDRLPRMDALPVARVLDAATAMLGVPA